MIRSFCAYLQKLSRYPNHGAYVGRVARAVGHLEAHRYILPADADAIVRAAAHNKALHHRRLVLRNCSRRDQLFRNVKD